MLSFCHYRRAFNCFDSNVLPKQIERVPCVTIASATRWRPVRRIRVLQDDLWGEGVDEDVRSWWRKHCRRKGKRPVSGTKRNNDNHPNLVRFPKLYGHKGTLLQSLAGENPNFVHFLPFIFILRTSLFAWKNRRWVLSGWQACRIVRRTRAATMRVRARQSCALLEAVLKTMFYHSTWFVKLPR